MLIPPVGYQTQKFEEASEAIARVQSSLTAGAFIRVHKKFYSFDEFDVSAMLFTLLPIVTGLRYPFLERILGQDRASLLIPDSFLEATPSTLTCVNGGTLDATVTPNVCKCGFGYSGTTCAIACSSHGEFSEGVCQCTAGYSGDVCQVSVADLQAKLEAYCGGSPDMENLGAAGVELNSAEAALRSLCPPPSTTNLV